MKQQMLMTLETPHCPSCRGPLKNALVDLDKEMLCGFEEIACPFCGEKDFDFSGLKGHLTSGDCKKYEETNAPQRIFA